MVKGLDIFYEYFSEYSDQYVLIGGSACDLSFSNYDEDFRATKDLDMVLIVEAQTKEFAQRFWEFIKKVSIGIALEVIVSLSFTDLISQKK